MSIFLHILNSSSVIGKGKTSTVTPIQTNPINIKPIGKNTTGTNAPVTGTNAPVTGTNAPVTGTNAPVTGTNAPITGTNAPVTGTNAPVTNTQPLALANNAPTIIRTQNLDSVVNRICLKLSGIMRENKDFEVEITNLMNGRNLTKEFSDKANVLCKKYATTANNNTLSAKDKKKNLETIERQIMKDQVEFLKQIYSAGHKLVQDNVVLEEHGDELVVVDDPLKHVVTKKTFENLMTLCDQVEFGPNDQKSSLISNIQIGSGVTAGLGTAGATIAALYKDDKGLGTGGILAIFFTLLVLVAILVTIFLPKISYATNYAEKKEKEKANKANAAELRKDINTLMDTLEKSKFLK